MDAMETMLENVSVETSTTMQATFRNRVRNIVARLKWLATLHRSRIALSELTDVQLNDIGVSRSEAEREARRMRLF